MIDRKAFNARVIEAFRTHNGSAPDQVGDMLLLLLTTTGAKSGRPRLSPLADLMDGDRYVVVASKGGSPTDPERTRLLNAVAEVWPQLRQYEQNTERTLPGITRTRV